MSEFTQLVASQEIITPPIPEKIYDRKWIDMLTITSPSTNNIRLYCKMIPCRDNAETGDKELKTNLTQSDISIIQIENVWDIIGTNPKFAMAMELIFQSVNDYGIQQGIFKNPSVTTDTTTTDTTTTLPIDQPVEETTTTTTLPIDPPIDPPVEETTTTTTLPLDPPIDQPVEEETTTTTTLPLDPPIV